MKKILIIEDEYPISQVIKVYLKKAGYDVEQVFDGSNAMDTFKHVEPDLVILDVMLPGVDGWTLLQDIRSKCAVIMLTALGDVNYRLDGLNQGADDYIAKPFHGEELVARVQAVLRRIGNKNNNSNVIKFGTLEIDVVAHRVRLLGTIIELTPRDLSLLLFFADNPNRTFTREQLLDSIWGWDYDGSDRAVDLSIKRLRKSLKDWPKSEGEIKTFRGLGYQFCVYK
ncbi:response regulator transcription factor [Oceanobacillus iheyensis]|uniref:Transcriptional regulator n=1 Tax=Oceanobacillus iheyensis (strain DSM 14371 / CIP 107618 / JCM 11309 / KCTC 3954 / HTE831) TaxID=221109 RepID=Q8ENG8_OCEIH|nr:response regulator transcription factor [Oceanobacillus iheyensis]BAC14471.1 transcriptional regulator [Oceanobacillus iheyensis HTE831]